MVILVCPDWLETGALSPVAFGAATWITCPSGIVTSRRKPSGLPSFAGRNLILMASPLWRAFSPVLPIPRCASAVAEPIARHPIG